MLLRLFLFLVLSFALPAAISAENEVIAFPEVSTHDEISRVQMVAENTTLQKGEPFWVCFHFQIAPDWHLYWTNPGEAGVAPRIDWSLPPGFRAGNLLWPAPDRIQVGDSVIFGYSKQLLLLAEILPPADLENGTNIDLGASVNWLACSTTCVPQSASFKMSLAVSDSVAPPTKRVQVLFRQARKALPITSKSLTAALIDGELSITIFQEKPFGHVHRVLFFPAQEALLDPKLFPTWQLSSSRRELKVQLESDALSAEKVALPFKGVLVVEVEGPMGQKRLGFNVSAPSFQVNEEANEEIVPLPPPPAPVEKVENPEPAPEEPVNVEEHLQALEAKVWYRALLSDFTTFVRSEFFNVLLLAFIGGIILNLMPCVLPVISFKLLHFAELRTSSRMTVAKHGIMYSFGILISFWALAATIYALQYTGKAVGWGFQLQEPVFVACLVIVLFILSLSLFGLFEFGLGLSSTAGAWDSSFRQRIPLKSSEPSLAASFFSGVLATLVASPCTGPLLGTAVGFAATLKPTYSFAVFSALGLGMAFPFLLVSFFPSVTKLFPKPGRWMVTFKQLMGFFLLATIIWLVWVLDAQTANLSTLSVLLNLVVIAFGVWIYGTWGGLDRSGKVRQTGRIVALLVVIWGSWMFISDVSRSRPSAHGESAEAKPSQLVGSVWEEYSQPRLDRLRATGVPVFVDVTAKWCLTCQANKIVLESDAVKAAFVKYGIVKMQADWTTNDESITRYLRSLGRNGVPVYALYGRQPNGAPTILPELLTPDIVINALKAVHDESGS